MRRGGLPQVFQDPNVPFQKIEESIGDGNTVAVAISLKESDAVSATFDVAVLRNGRVENRKTVGFDKMAGEAKIGEMTINFAGGSTGNMIRVTSLNARQIGPHGLIRCSYKVFSPVGRMSRSVIRRMQLSRLHSHTAEGAALFRSTTTQGIYEHRQRTSTAKQYWVKLEQRTFIERGLASRDAAKQSGKYVSSEKVLRELDRMLANAKIKRVSELQNSLLGIATLHPT